MKPPVLILVALLGIAGALLGLTHLAGLTDSAETLDPLTPGPDPATASGTARQPGGIAAERSDARHPVPGAEAPPASHREPTPEERARIFQALAAENERHLQGQALARFEKQQQEFKRRATIIADRLSLPAGSADKLASLFVAERDKIAAIREEFHAAGRSAQSREALRTSVREVSTWRDKELTLLFGAEVAADIAKFEDHVEGEDRVIDKQWKPAKGEAEQKGKDGEKPDDGPDEG